MQEPCEQEVKEAEQWVWTHFYMCPRCGAIPARRLPDRDSAPTTFHCEDCGHSLPCPHCHACSYRACIVCGRDMAEDKKLTDDPRIAAIFQQLVHGHFHQKLHNEITKTAQKYNLPTNEDGTVLGMYPGQWPLDETP